MSTTRTYSRPVSAPASSVPVMSRFHIADLLLPAGIALWVLGVRRTDASVLGPYGLPVVLPVIFYAGIGVLVLSAAIELSRSHISTERMSLHAVALTVMLYGTAPLIYSQGRYSWLYKTMGVVQYINSHGHLNSNIDIYQNWPGFFALAAWFGKAAGVASPLAYAKWAQLAFELAAIPLLYLIYDALSLTVRQRWVAVLLYLASNWIGQDYFSPQALGTVLSLGVMALAMRWLYQGGSLLRRRRNAMPSDLRAHDPDQPIRPVATGVVIPAAVCLVFFVLTFTHELSPYMLVVQVGALAALRLLRPRWLPVALAAIAVAYLIPRFPFVNTRFGVLKSLGEFFSNAAPPSFDVVSLSPEQLIIQRCAEALSGGVWLLAVLGAWLRRRAGRPILGLVILAFSPIILLAVQAYGNEGILRVYLFSLPWCAALGAMALAPQPAGAVSHRAPRSRGAVRPVALEAGSGAPAGARAPVPGRQGRGAARIPLALMVVLALFFPAFFGDDASNVMPEAEVATVTFFMQHAPAGTLYCAIDHLPASGTSRYNLFPVVPLFGHKSLLGTRPLRPDIAQELALTIEQREKRDASAYVMIASSMVAYNRAYKVVSTANITHLRLALGQSPYWKLLAHSSGTWIYELQPRLPTTPTSLGDHHF